MRLGFAKFESAWAWELGPIKRLDDYCFWASHGGHIFSRFGGLYNDLKSLPFAVTEGSDGFPLIHAQYLGETKTFTQTQAMAVVDCCIGIPIYFTNLQRRAVMDVAKIAGLHPLRLMHETTATVLVYGIHKTDLPENEQLNVACVDIGHASMQVCIAGFKKGQLKILVQSFDRCLGGRDFDEVLFQHFAEKFKTEFNN
ncbi:putative Heat shock protein 70 family [Helianthus annuus]|nr:putative Heat shock protein 70 family [Helianthus annuus]